MTRRIKTPAYCIKNVRTKEIHAFKRKLDAVYFHCGMRYRPYLKWVELDCHLKLNNMKAYTVKGDF
jgi:hypothetical protein